MFDLLDFVPLQPAKLPFSVMIAGWLRCQVPETSLSRWAHCGCSVPLWDEPFTYIDIHCAHVPDWGICERTQVGGIRLTTPPAAFVPLLPLVCHSFCDQAVWTIWLLVKFGVLSVWVILRSGRWGWPCSLPPCPIWYMLFHRLTIPYLFDALFVSDLVRWSHWRCDC